MNTLASACGKIILAGEHAVVYHQPGIALPIHNLRATCEILVTEPFASARLLAPDLGLDLDLTGSATGTDNLEHALITTVRRAQQELGISQSHSLKVSSQIPIKRGLGSGSAISAAIYKALANHAQIPFSPEQVYDFVQEIEAIYHGRPSGIDAQVIAYEQAVFFQRDQAPQVFQVPPQLALLVIDTGPAAPTHEVVNWVAEQMRLYPEAYQALMQAIGQISQAIYALLAEMSQSDSQGNLDKAHLQVKQQQSLGALLNQNQVLLKTMGISSVAQDQLLAQLQAAGAWGAKVSGAGRGGICIATGPDLDALQVLCEALAYSCWQLHF